jgi:hypothetical protein
MERKGGEKSLSPPNESTHGRFEKKSEENFDVYENDERIDLFMNDIDEMSINQSETKSGENRHTFNINRTLMRQSMLSYPVNLDQTSRSIVNRDLYYQRFNLDMNRTFE